jgi:ABC-type multidrug transport system ATPase subunit
MAVVCLQMASEQSVLEVRGLGRSFGSRTVLRDIDVRLSAGGRLGLSGPNGSGKTTLLRCIAGSLIPSSGSIEVAGHPAGSLPARDAIGTTFSPERAFYQRLSGRRNLLFYASLRGKDPRVAAESVIEELELDFAGERVDRCSTGMVQQLSFARALLGDPKLLLLDEPTRSLDTSAVDRLWSALERRPSVAVVVASHQADDLERCDERIELS